MLESPWLGAVHRDFLLPDGATADRHAWH